MWNNDQSKFTLIAISSTQMLCGAIILALLHCWLRSRDVKDRSLVWLYVSLLTWAAAGALQLALHRLMPALPDADAQRIQYLVSPVSSILFTMTAFQLARVREFFCWEDRRTWPRSIVIAVSVISVTAFLLQSVNPAAARHLDAAASSLALIVLGLSLMYSFYLYGNQLLAALTGITILYQVAKQFRLAEEGIPYGTQAVMNFAGNTMLIMLFIALAVAWGLSDSARLRLVGHTSNVYVAALFFDLRGSTQWVDTLLSVGGDLQTASAFLDKLRDWAWKEALSVTNARPDFVKFLGDGYLFVWEAHGQDAKQARASGVINLALALYNAYPAWAESSGLSHDLGSVPTALGIGVDVGNVIRVTYENGAYDYIGAAINNAAKLQNFARPHGGVLVRTAILNWCQRDNPAAFHPTSLSAQGVVSIGERSTEVSVTDGIVFSSVESVTDIQASA